MYYANPHSTQCEEKGGGARCLANQLCCALQDIDCAVTFYVRQLDQLAIELEN